MYLERTVTVNKGTASIDEPVILYKGDKNIEIQFTIKNSPFKYKYNPNSAEMTYGQLVVKRETAEPIFSEVSQLSNGKILFVITGEMIDELNEIGKYTFQIRLFNSERTSRGSLPIIENGIVIKEPLCDEDVEEEPIAKKALSDVGEADVAVINESGQAAASFDEDLNYNKTNWSTGMVISSAKLNKIEKAIYDVNNIARTNVGGDYVTEEELEAKGYLTEHQDISHLATKEELFSKDYNDLTNKPEIPSIEGLATNTQIEDINNQIGDIESILKSINGEEEI